jgi:hypothetical protein
MQLEYLNAAAVKLAADAAFGLAGEEEPHPAASNAMLAIAAASGLARRDWVRVTESRFVREGWMVCIAAASTEAVKCGLASRRGWVVFAGSSSGRGGE